MAIILAQAVLANDNGLAEDAYVNTFHFNGVADVATATILGNALAAFYTTNYGTGAIATYLSPQVSLAANAMSVKFYDVTTGPSGTPFHTTLFTMGAPAAGDPLPSEAAVCLSYKANPLAGAVEARRRGRIYIGPLNVTAMSGLQIARPHADLMSTLLTAADNLHSSANGASAPWVIYSRVNDTTALVQQAWVDNAFDTQRRRGAAPTARTTLVL